MERGKFIVVDGLDGCGKGVIIDTFVEEAIKEGKRVFDVHKFWNENDFHPNPKEIIGEYDIILTSEPTFVGAGRVVRDELIAKNGRKYSPETVAGGYSLDRHILYEQLLLPVLEAGIDVYQSRSFSTSIVYQQQTALDLGREFSMDEIMKLPGNAFCYEHPMDFMIVPTIEDVSEVIRRLDGRDKDDNCEFENLEFQLKLKKQYDSSEFREVFERKGVKLVSMDVGGTLEYSKEQAREFYRVFLR